MEQPSPIRQALRVAGAYAVAAGAWIILSGWLLSVLPIDQRVVPQVEIGKGIGFVAVTAGVLLVAVLRNARQSAAAAAALRRQAAILGAVGDAIVVTDPAGVVTYWNAGARRIYGLAEPEAVGRPLRDLASHAPLSPEATAGPLTTPAGDGPWHGDLAIDRRDGTSGRVEVFSTLMRDRSGQADRISVIRDVTEQRQAADAAARDAAIVESAIDAIWSTDSRAIVTSWNPGAERLLGYRASDMVGRSSEDLLPDDRKGEVAPLVGRIVAGERVRGYETVRVALDGSQIPVALSISPVRSASGTVVGTSVIAHDLREERRLERQLQHAQKMEAVGRLADGVAHDFNNVLTAIMGFAQLVEREVPPDSEAAGDADQIVQAAERAAAIVRQLLTFSRSGPGEPRLVELGGAVDALLPMLRRLVGGHVEISVAHTDPAPVLIDPTELEQVLLNLVVNGAHAMPVEGRLRLETGRALVDGQPAGNGRGPGLAVLVVSDTGEGMDDETRAHIFEPFFTTRPEGEGTGLGLATVLRIVRRAHGTIDVESRPGGGTTFRVLLPLASAGATREAPRNEQIPAGGTERILLVADDLQVRSLAAQALGRFGYRVDAAEDVCAAQRLPRARDYDLLLTDVALPGIRGPELAASLTASRPGLRVLYLSDRAECVADDVSGDHVLRKPFLPDELARSVRITLDERATDRAGIVGTRS